MAPFGDGFPDHDYAVCPETTDGTHEPRIALMQDSEMPEGYVTFECSACHQTTGVYVGVPEDIDWG